MQFFSAIKFFSSIKFFKSEELCTAAGFMNGAQQLHTLYSLKLKLTLTQFVSEQLGHVYSQQGCWRATVSAVFWPSVIYITN